MPQSASRGIKQYKNWIKVAYMGSAAKYQQMTALALDPKSDVNLIFVTLEWLFTERLGNKAKVYELYRANNLALIAINKVRLMYKWHSFRPLYAQCQELPTEFLNTLIMTLSATVTPDILVKLIHFCSTPVIEKGSSQHIPGSH